MNSIALFNNSALLFENARAGYRSNGKTLQVFEGHVFVVQDFRSVARFESDDAAIDALESAGYVRDEADEINIIFNP